MTPRDPNWQVRLLTSFASQPFMALIGARITAMDPGRVEVSFDVDPKLTQQHGFVHAGATWTAMDVAGGYAAQSLMAASDSVLTTELKSNFLAPAQGIRIRAVAQVLKAGRNLTVTESKAYALGDSGETLIAAALATYMTMKNVADRGSV